MNIFYRLGQKLYVNITNACPCACVFCIRDTTNSVGDAESLWLSHEPSLDEILTAFNKRSDIKQVTEIVFCGYGEPLERANDVIEICKYIKSTYPTLPIRINTNGLVKLINPDFEISKLAVVDSVSISLNADDAEEYMRLVNPRFGEPSFEALLEFSKAVSEFTEVTLTVVEDVLSPERVERCKAIAESLNLPLRIRTMM